VNGCAYRANAGYYGDTCPQCNGTGEPSFADKVDAASADAEALLDAWLDDDIDISALMNALIAADQAKALELLTKLSALEDAFADAYLAAKADDDVNAALEALKEYYRAMVALIEEYFGVTAPQALKDALAPAHTHAFGTAWIKDAANHWKECDCGEKDGLAAHTPGAAATCTTAQTCTICSAELAPAIGHTPGAAATCTTAQACTVCSAELAPATSHTPGAAAACTEAQTCTVCSAEVAPATGHTPGEVATCTTAQACTVCSAELAPATGHTPGAAATCTEAQTCTVCSAELAPAAGHTPGDWIVDKAATTKAEGSRHKECMVCGDVTATEIIPLIPRYVGLFGRNTGYPATTWNWFKFFVLFGFIWMWF